MLCNVFAPVRADVVFALLRLFASFVMALVRATLAASAAVRRTGAAASNAGAAVAVLASTVCWAPARRRSGLR